MGYVLAEIRAASLGLASLFTFHCLQKIIVDTSHLSVTINADAGQHRIPEQGGYAIGQTISLSHRDAQVGATCDSAPKISSESQSWLCLYTQPKQEVVTAQQLSKFWPVYNPRIQRYRKLEFREPELLDEPLFQRYVFVQAAYVELPTAWANGIRLPVRPVKIGAEPALVPEAVIDLLRARECNGYVQLHDALSIGAAIEITAGTFNGWTAVVKRLLEPGLSGLQRVAVLLEVCGRPQTLTFERMELRAI